MLALRMINNCMYHTRCRFHSVIFFHFRWRRKRETSASSSKATPPPFPSLPYPAILRRLLNKKKKTHFLLYHASKQKNTTTIISERSSAFFLLVDCADASCECPMAMSQLLPQSFSTISQAWVFSFPSRARNERVRTRGDVRRWWTISIFPAGAAALFNQFLSARVQQHTHKCLQLSLCKRYTFLGILQEETANSGDRGVATTKHRRCGCENCICRTSCCLLNLCSGTCRGPNIRVLATQWTTARVSKRIFIEA